MCASDRWMGRSYTGWSVNVVWFMSQKKQKKKRLTYMARSVSILANKRTDRHIRFCSFVVLKNEKEHYSAIYEWMAG
ncbi:hypothetical protein ADH70_018065 [Blautia pseudococcoides]|uniref:Uncharacterized protein n=1 Tax=Blautia pseudococcoides TaxID=1796616 RepID=A0A1C7IDH2_9FIRM|nr:hypothetical protein A4V09_19470 [Blautia pseudococcoides]ASU30534.1 hypothetical protein ADH70_018065 [Blautia pseudococcoides]